MVKQLMSIHLKVILADIKGHGFDTEFANETHDFTNVPVLHSSSLESEPKEKAKTNVRREIFLGEIFLNTPPPFTVASTVQKSLCVSQP